MMPRREAKMHYLFCLIFIIYPRLPEKTEIAVRKSFHRVNALQVTEGHKLVRKRRAAREELFYNEDCFSHVLCCFDGLLC